MVATGFNSLGIVCLLVAGELVRAPVLDDESAMGVELLRLSRFVDASTEFEIEALHHDL